MSGLSKRMSASLAGSSWIRKMYDEGERLRALHGADAIADLSLGNPMEEPPRVYLDALARAVANAPPGSHRYMPNAGFRETRVAVAANLTREFGLPFALDNVVMTVGTAGAVNVALKSLVDDNDEVIILAPYFTEYPYYIENHGARSVIVRTTADFLPDPEAIARAITPRTRVVIINSPNNPTGRVYGADLVARVGEVLRRAGDITLISDEPYRRLVYDGRVVPSVLDAFEETILCTSYSKDLSIPGERIGFAAVSPKSRHVADLVAGMAFANRALGFVNAPALQQRVVASLQGVSVDCAPYRRKRDRLCAALSALGHRFVPPEGAFYLFMEAEGGDDIAFTRKLIDERVIVVPGVGFGVRGWVRLAYCVDDAVIDRAIAGFTRVASTVA